VFHRWGHCQVFSEERIRSLLRKYGFGVVEIRKTNLWFLAKFGFLAHAIYFFHIDRLAKQIFCKDLFVVAKKVSELKE